jgi:hypothetical protein
LFATYASALIIVIGSLAVGRALTRALGWRETTWLEPVVGFSLLAVVGSLSIRLFDSGGASVIVLGVLIVASLIYLRLKLLPAADLRMAAGPGLIAAAVASVPLLANLRIGIMGVGINNDLAEHLLWAEWLRDQSDQAPVGLDNGYPIGPHSIAASLGQAFGFEMTDAIVGLLIAIAALTALTALFLLRELPPGRRLIGCALVALPYMTASALAVGGFKETTYALIVLGFVVGLAKLERDYPGDGALLVSLGVIAAGAISVYSYPGLYWLIAAAGLLGLVGLARAFSGQNLAETLRRAVPVLLVPLVVFLILAVTEFGRAKTFHDHSGIQTTISGDSKLRDAVSPLETLGAWPDGNFLAGIHGPAAWPLFALLGLAAFGFAAMWWWRRGSIAVPLGVLGAVVIYLGTLIGAGLYVQAKALAVPAPLVMLFIVRALLDARGARAPESEEAAEPTSSRWGIGRIGLATAFGLVCAVSSLLALRDSVVAPNEHADELSSIRQKVQGDWTLSLTTDRYTDYQLRTTMVGSPARNAQIIVPSRNGKDFRLPLDFDSVAPETLDVFDWVLVTSAPYRSQPPKNLRLVESTDSYELWKRVGPSQLNERVFGEEARPGKVLNCTPHDIKVGAKRQFALTATVFDPPPVIGKRFSWKPSGELGPGDSATQTLNLPAGDWDLSMQYQSPVVGLSVDAAGESFDVPAAMDGAIPFRFGEGPFWPVGQISSSGGPVEITARVDDLSTFQDLIGVNRKAAIGNIVATQTDPYRTIPFAAAPGPPCGDYVDSYTIDPRRITKGVVKHRRLFAQAALSGHYQPKDLSDEEKQPGRNR